jgi:hypothetical protein
VLGPSMPLDTYFGQLTLDLTEARYALSPDSARGVRATSVALMR